MTRLARVFPVILATALACAMPAAAGGFAEIEALTREWVAKGDLHGSVLVAKNGRIVFKQGFGYANREWNIRNTPETKFRIGSVTKQFTAAIVLQLVGEDKLQLDDTVVMRLPYYREDTGSKITLRHLLTHSSGIPNYTSDKRFREGVSRDPYSVETFVKEFCSGDLEFVPGTKAGYSNSGYFLLGAIIEQATQMSYAEALRQRIFDPLGMADSGYDDFTTIVEDRAAGYKKENERVVNADYLDMTLPFAAGALYSTVEDLYRWDQALYGEMVLAEELKATMFAPVISNFALGWRVTEFTPKGTDLKRTEISHGGGIDGFRSFILRVPEDRHLVVVLNNMEHADAGKLANEIRDCLYAP